MSQAAKILAAWGTILVWAPVAMTAAESSDPVCMASEPRAIDAGAGDAEPEAAGEPQSAPEVFDELLVTGGPEEVDQVPGAATFIPKEVLRQQDSSDIHRVLKQVAGVNIQEEEGYGLRPNIGMRGTGVDRSQKITLLEDGVLIAPAPYAAPAAYYFPSPGRMEALEVRKGSSAIRQGPNTNGGVINLVSTAIPGRFGGRIGIAVGEDSTRRLHAHVGDSAERYGWLLETFRLETDGFKDLDGGGPTGVDLEDYVAKLRFNTRSDAQVYQAVELKLGMTEQFGPETYLGLTDEDFRRTPRRRYAGSQEDWIESDHEQVQLRHTVHPGGDFHITSTVYRNDFFRNWHKLQSVAGIGISSVLKEPDFYADELSILQGDRDDETGALRIRNNRRRYLAEGVETVLGWSRETDSIGHHFELGVRLHRDEEDRFQEEDRWNMVRGRMGLEELGAPGSQSNRIDRAEALAAYVRDDISFGRLTLSPGIRFESIDFERRDYGESDPRRGGTALQIRRNDIEVLIPGLGANFQIDPVWNVFGGLHKGFAPPAPGQDADTKAEESLNIELGLRYRKSLLSATLVGFFSDYDNLLGRDTLSAGGEGSGDTFNGGESEAKGLEASLAYDFGKAQDWSLSVPLHFAYTYTAAEFESSFETSFPDWAPAVRAGDELPYLPKHQLNASLGLVYRRWSVFGNLNFVDEMRTSVGTGPIPEGEGTDAQTVLDLATSYSLQPGLKLTLRVQNLTDDTSIVARRPAGIRPGLPRTILVGIDWDF